MRKRSQQLARESERIFDKTEAIPTTCTARVQRILNPLRLPVPPRGLCSPEKHKRGQNATDSANLRAPRWLAVRTGTVRLRTDKSGSERVSSTQKPHTRAAARLTAGGAR